MILFLKDVFGELNKNVYLNWHWFLFLKYVRLLNILDQVLKLRVKKTKFSHMTQMFKLKSIKMISIGQSSHLNYYWL